MVSRPMLAEKATDEQVAAILKEKGPLWGFAKIDGVRCLNRGFFNERDKRPEGDLLSRSMKKFPNLELNEMFGGAEFRGLDGELTVTEPNDPMSCRAASGAVATIKGSSPWKWWVFDNFRNPDLPFHERYARIPDFGPMVDIYRLPFHLITSVKDFREIEREIVERQGFEGLILRDPNAKYKEGRATVKEGSMLKIKRFVDAEAEVVGFEEEMANTNTATIDERGYTKRSNAKAGMIGKGTLGALICRDPTTGVEFSVGGGFTADERIAYWANREALIGRILTYKHLPVGQKEKPRHTGFVAFREKFDMDPVRKPRRAEAEALL